MTQHSIDFLLIMPELFQVILINIFLLFAICFSYYNIERPPGNIFEIALLGKRKDSPEIISNNKLASKEFKKSEKQPGLLDSKLQFNTNPVAFHSFIPSNLSKTLSGGFGGSRRLLCYPY